MCSLRKRRAQKFHPSDLFACERWWCTVRKSLALDRCNFCDRLLNDHWWEKQKRITLIIIKKKSAREWERKERKQWQANRPFHWCWTNEASGIIKVIIFTAWVFLVNEASLSLSLSLSFALFLLHLEHAVACAGRSRGHLTPWSEVQDDTKQSIGLLWWSFNGSSEDRQTSKWVWWHI